VLNAGYLWRWLVSPELLDVQVLDEFYARQNGGTNEAEAINMVRFDGKTTCGCRDGARG